MNIEKKKQKKKTIKSALFPNTFFPFYLPQKQMILSEAACNIERHLRKQLRDIIPYFSDMIPHAGLDQMFGKRKDVRHRVSFSPFSDSLSLPILFHADTSSSLSGVNMHFLLATAHLWRSYGRQPQKRRAGGLCLLQSNNSVPEFKLTLKPLRQF